MIEYIEKLDAELQVQVLFDFIIFEQRKIEVHQTGPVNLIVTTIAQEV